MVWAEHVSLIGNPEGVAATLGWPLTTLEAIAADLQTSPRVWGEQDRQGAWDSNDEAVPSGLPHYELRTVIVRGKSRLIHVPQFPVKVIQIQIRELLRYPAEELLHDSCHGYRVGRSARTNATPHSGRLHLQKFDIADFFPSTTHAMVMNMLEDLGFDAESSRLLADLSTLRDSLPMGSPSSPVISNLMLASFDEELASEASRVGVTYTRYADDMTLSSDKPFNMSRVVQDLTTDRGYRLSQRKSVSSRRGQATTVTGLVVWDGPPRLPKRFRSRLQTELHYIELHGIEQHALREYSWSWIDADANPEKHIGMTRAHVRGKILYALSVQRAWTERQLSKRPRASKELMGTVQSRAETRAKRLEFLRHQAASIRARSEPRPEVWNAS